ncbi:MAG: hypothetical protein KDE51_10480, partial [Anaerolineales bacterium]|nr:hypothetical protein [Anaerolineales bacterium]
LEAHLHESAPTLTIDAIQVIVLAKKATGIMPHLKSYEVDFSELANKVTQEFTNMTAGLISNAVLLSLTKIRQNTFKIINNFSKDLDAPFLTHRALQVDPRDAEEHLTGLIAEEIQAILEEAQIGQETTKLEMVKLWLESTDFKIPSTEMYLPVAAIKQLRNVNNPQGIEKIKKYIAKQQDISEEHKNQLSDLLDIEYDDINELTRHLVSWVDAHSELSNFLESKKSDIISLLEDGIQAWETKPKGLREQNSHTFQFTKLFTNSPRDPFDLDEQFALTSSTRSFYGDDTRKLTLGTIVKRDLQYLVCVQPKCDTYRLTEPRVFLFLPLSLAKEETFNFVVKDNGKYKRLILEKKPYQLVLLEFEPTKERQIVTTQNGKYTATDGAMYEWIAELRFEHAQRISNRLATDLSRVGVNESQWLRRWAKE